MNKEEIKFDHFKDIEELIQHLEMWYAEDDYYAYDRYFHLRDARIMGMFIYELQQENKQLREELKAVRKGLSKVSVKRNKWKNRYYKEKRKNKQLKEVINKAIEYINNNYPLRTSFSKNIYDFKIEIKKILTGDSNE